MKRFRLYMGMNNVYLSGIECGVEGRLEDFSYPDFIVKVLRMVQSIKCRHVDGSYRTVSAAPFMRVVVIDTREDMSRNLKSLMSTRQTKSGDLFIYFVVLRYISGPNTTDGQSTYIESQPVQSTPCSHLSLRRSLAIARSSGFRRKHR